MIIIVITVVTQGFRVPSEARGEIKSHLLYNTGFFQAVGVISFGELWLFPPAIERLLTNHSICLSYVILRYRAALHADFHRSQQPPHLRLLEKTNP